MITIELSIPSKYLSPNFSAYTRAGTQARIRAKCEQKKSAYIKALAVRPDAPYKRAKLHVAFYDKQKRGNGRDYDNSIASLKGAIDGIAAAGVIENDNGLVPGKFVLDFDKDDPRVVIGIEEIDE